MPPLVNVLYVDSDPEFAARAAERLQAANDRLAVATVDHPDDALDRLDSERVDCVVSDHDPPEMDGVELLAAVRAEFPDLPFVLFTGTGSEAVASEAISAGATDYLQRDGSGDQYAVLANRLVNAVEQRESRTSYREIFEKAADGIFIHDPETGRVNDVNPRAAEMLGYSREELLEMDVGEFSADRPEFSQAEAARRVRQAVEEGPQTFEWLFQGKDGETFWIEVHLKLAVINGRDQVIAMTRDISERKERERRLVAQKEKVKSLHGVAADIEACEGPGEVYDLVLDAASDILNYDRGIVDALEGDVLVPVAVPEDIPAEEYHETTPVDAEDSLAARAFREGESHVVDDLGELDVAPAEPTYRSAITVPIADYGLFQAVAEAPGRFDETDLELTELLAGHAREALSRLEREEELRAYADELERQNERLDEFASVVSHDLRSPLGVAKGRIELAREERDGDDLRMATDALDRMEDILEHTLALAREGESVGETERLSLAALAERSWRVVATDAAELRVTADPTVEADPDRFQHLLENLFRNATEHADDDVTVTVGTIDDGFYVADDGPGIPPEHRDGVFEPGYTTAEHGTGFGLAIVAEIVDAHHAEVAVTESEDGGARFEFTGFRESR